MQPQKQGLNKTGRKLANLPSYKGKAQEDTTEAKRRK